MKILFYLFYFYFLSTFLLCQEKNITECFQEDSCYDSVNKKCIKLNGDTYHEQKKKFNEVREEYKAVTFEQLKCKTNGFVCRQRYSNDIKENCFKAFEEPDDDNKDHCCYMTLDFKYNKKHECYPVPRDKDKIKGIIDELEDEYYGIKNIKIKCKSQYITFGFFLLFNILFLF
jgi:hypothetical protein